jgi:APA family basic amino acid/polyamine antiporter
VTKLARRLGAFDATLIVMGGIVGTGIFMNPAVVAARAHTTPLILSVWLVGGIIALIGAFIFAELAWRRPSVGGTYGYLRDAFHPVLAFMSGWTSLFVTNSGSYAATAVTFAIYASPFLHVATVPLAVAVIAVMSGINCFGVGKGAGVQNAIMVVKIVAIGGLIAAGFFAPAQIAHAQAIVAPAGIALVGALGAALLPVFYSYDGWQTAPFMDEELKDPQRTLPLGLIWGVVGVVILYIAVTLVSLRVLGPAGLAASQAPATDILQRAIGPGAAALMSGCIALSTIGFLSNTALTIPRLYFAMANDGLFFKQIAYVHPKTKAPVNAVLLQAVVAIVIVLVGKYDQILNYVTSMDFLYMVLFAIALVIFRKRAVAGAGTGVRVPLHPWSTLVFAAVSLAVVINSYVAFPKDTLIGLLILLSGAPVYFIWVRRAVPQAVPTKL